VFGRAVLVVGFGGTLHSVRRQLLLAKAHKSHVGRQTVEP
jgi:hypothetical protein